MQIETLREFIAVVQYGSFTGAAKALYLSQPTLSKHIAAFEKQIGYKLFFDERPLILTEAGRIAMEYASSVVSQTETMQLRLEGLKHQKPELVRIQDLTFFEHLSLRSQDVKKAVRERYPNITFETVKCKTHQTSREALEAGTIDVGFQFNITESPFQPPVDMPGTVRMQPLYGSLGQFRLGVPKGSPLLAQDKRLRLKDFANQRFFIIANRNYDAFIHDFRSLCLREGFLPQIEFVTVSNNRDFWMRDYGDGVVFLDATQRTGFTSADDYLADKYKAVRPFGHEQTLYVVISLLTRNEKHGPALQSFLDIVRETEDANLERMKAEGLE
ncbi:LysR family transcriptional regulator [Eggerthella sinensis]|jgi:DNA-binding transcriptional LysR family regulator|uniref:HTH lysR-type domain-containing protein n=1 Tax=Eggerthella sinensis TaxID=242230 RepID=A0A3N0IVN0_9ACTN|nr:LysR family transcriptional regulator [Eggerthella sinensis]MCB7037764.1 LysR family transcriptional regulator [Eggerthella sinensis]RDB68603.1 hypothetical protein C1876_09120 [Eggerthella sinensis]RNM40402.1 hypothetical protein DMP09_14440 [Eggerthella sinensis]